MKSKRSILTPLILGAFTVMFLSILFNLSTNLSTLLHITRVSQENFEPSDRRTEDEAGTIGVKEIGGHLFRGKIPEMGVSKKSGKGLKDRVVYLSKDSSHALIDYLKVRSPTRAKRVFLVEKGRFRGKPISVRGIQKRMEQYAQKAGLKACCHQLRHTMATQLLNADADLLTVQDLLGHTRMKTTQRYRKVSNLKVQRDYFKAMEAVMQRMGGGAEMT